MKKILKILSIIVLSQILLSCDNNNYFDENESYNKPKYYPVVMKRSDFEKAITNIPPQELENVGKIYLKDNHIFIIEKYKGIHIINNENLLIPKKIAFIRIPGCLNMAIKKNFLFADSAIDLVTIDISDFNSIKEVSRKRNVFSELLPPESEHIYNDEDRPNNSIIVEWQEAK